MLSAGVFDIPNLLALTGDHTIIGDHQKAKPVFDLDSVSILKTAFTLNCGIDSVGLELKGKTDFYLGACVSQGYNQIYIQILKMKKKINAGENILKLLDEAGL